MDDTKKYNYIDFIVTTKYTPGRPDSPSFSSPSVSLAS